MNNLQAWGLGRGAYKVACYEMLHTSTYSFRRTKQRFKMAVFWVVAPCSLVELYQRFRGPCCLHHQGDLLN
jgi:hypothetical protein